jgi:hypothetical protein
MDEIKIEILCTLCRNDKIIWTLHALKRIRKRKISPKSVIDTILSGEIIKQYQTDKPFPSCLIFNKNTDTPLHAVVSSDNKNVYIVTAYYPTLNEWENDYKTRKEKK